MSWSINAIGTRTAIKAKIDASPYLPDSLKSAARDLIDANTALPDRLFHFRSHGHVGCGTGAVGEFKVETIELASDPENKSERERALEELVRSACAIAERKGDGTAWDRYVASAALLGLNGVTARTYRVLPEDSAPVS